MREQVAARGRWRYSNRNGVKVRKAFKNGTWHTLLEIFDDGVLSIIGDVTADIWVLNGGGSDLDPSDGGRIAEQYGIALTGKYHVQIGKTLWQQDITNNLVPGTPNRTVFDTRRSYANLSRFGRIGDPFTLAPTNGANTGGGGRLGAGVPTCPFDLIELLGRLAGGGGQGGGYKAQGTSGNTTHGYYGGCNGMNGNKSGGGSTGTASTVVHSGNAGLGLDGGGDGGSGAEYGRDAKIGSYGCGAGLSGGYYAALHGIPSQGVVFVLFETLVPRAALRTTA